jgi:hypothetical protein
MSIHLDGAETTIIKALGMSGVTVPGETLAERASGLEDIELLESLKGLISVGYVSCDMNNLKSIEDVRSTEFRINSGYIKELREALNPTKSAGKSRRVRRE